MSRFLRMITLAAILGASLAAPAPIARRQCSASVSTVDPTPTVPPVTLPTVSTDAPETTPAPSSSSDTPPAEPTDTPVPSPAPEDVPPAGGSADPDMVCNGDARLCDRKYSDVVFVGTHNSYALDGAGGLPGLANAASNQFIDVPAQLGMGIRFLQSQTHVKDDSLHVCHTSCDLYDGGSLEDYLKGVSTFLNDDANKNEVVTLLITNPENYPLEKWPDMFKAAGLDGLVYTPPSVPGTRADWPTMRELISANTRVVVLMDYNADTSKVPWILPEFDVMWESKFDEVDASFPCGVDRVNGDAGPKLGLINHYLDSEFLGILIPDRDAASTTNSVDSITAQVNNCAALGDAFKVTHVLLDWADKGQAIEAARKLNGLE